MCGSCGFPMAPGHWTDAGASAVPDKLRARFRRAQILQKVLPKFGLTAHDSITVPGLQLSTFSGNHVMVHDLSELWREAERMTGAAIDPLDPRLLGPSGQAD